MENTSTFLVLLLEKLRRVQSMYGRNMRRLENYFSTRFLIVSWKEAFRTNISQKRMSLCRTPRGVYVTSNTPTK